jgi:protein-disulfide isomerase
MNNLWQRVLHSKLFLWFCLGAVGVGLLVPLMFLLPLRGGSRSPDSREAQQAVVTEVMASMDRATLIGTSATKGNPNAQVVLFKFSDFQCRYCAVSAAQMKNFTGNHEDDLLYVYKHFPLNQIHPEATPAAKAAWAAGQQGQFWLYHDGLFAHQDRLGEDLYIELAEAMQLDMEQFNRDRTSPEAEAAIQQDLELAQRLQLRGTPSFIMNDLFIPGGAPPQLFEEIFNRINDLLKSKE